MMEENKTGFKQDIRIIRLSKWQIPKSKSVLDYMDNSPYLSIGYFDMIDIQRVEEMNIHPLLAAYKMSHRHLGKKGEDGQAGANSLSLLENYTMQELFVFTDVDESKISQNRIDRFWNTDSLIMFVSLIHVDNESKIDEIIAKINECFAEENFLFYFSFDYSGIVLLAKEMALKKYIQLMFRLNYGSGKKKKLIRDSYSFFGFDKSELRKCFDEFKGNSNYCEMFNANFIQDGNERFEVSVNVGIQNFNVYKEFEEEIMAVTPGLKVYGLFGRHDISIVNEQADLKWLVYVQYLLDKYTISNEKWTAEKLLFTHETFVKIQNIGEFEDVMEQEPEQTYDNAKNRLDMLCNTFFERLEHNLYNGEYVIPIHAVKLSILSILKNRFAEDFVLCMYQSFCEFIKYLSEKMIHENNDTEEFDKCFNNYFRGLNSLVNSAMHSERQFIQATAFNAIIYDVPSKIMAFYIAAIEKVQQIIRTEKDSHYTFLLTPSFSNEISVKIISYKKERLPHDRILMVSINERSLYNPKAVIRRMAHEVAHFAGHKLRNRALRKKRIKLSVIYIILSHILHGSFLLTDDLFDLISDIEKALSNDRIFSDEEHNYSEDLINVILPDMVFAFNKGKNVKKLLRRYIGKFLKLYLSGAPKNQYIREGKEKLQEYLAAVAAWHTGLAAEILDDSFSTKIFSVSDVQILTNLIYNDMKQEAKIINKDKEKLWSLGRMSQSIISQMGSNILNDKTVGEYAKGITNAYSEAFADVQMALLTDIGYEKYLEGFIHEEDLNVGRLLFNVEDISRISMVAFALQLTGTWRPINEIGALPDELHELHEKIKEQIEILKRFITDEGKEQATRYYGVAKGITEDSYDRKEDSDCIWRVDETMQIFSDNMVFYINENLLIYLVKCIDDSVKQYRESPKYEEIQKLRRTIRAVSDFESVGKAFGSICEEIREYKGKIFYMTTGDMV